MSRDGNTLSGKVDKVDSFWVDKAQTREGPLFVFRVKINEKNFVFSMDEIKARKLLDELAEKVG